MNNKQLTEICKVFELGIPIEIPTKVYGGLLHLMWRVNTDKGSYAVKELSEDIDLKNESIKRNYELTENIAYHFSQKGIPAVSALNKAGKHLFEIDGATFLVYPWVHDYSLNKNAISWHHALQIAGILAKLHLINLDMPDIKEPTFGIQPDDNIIKLIDAAKTYNAPFARNLEVHQNDLVAINNAYQQGIPLLKHHTVISHGDLDAKNVLWDKNAQPILIDWESARKLNPTYEIVSAALDWSGIITDHFNKKRFIQMIHAYVSAGGTIDKNLLQVAFNCVLGCWLDWLMYNVKRASVSEESVQKEVGIHQVGIVLPMIIRLKNNIPNLMKNIEQS